MDIDRGFFIVFLRGLLGELLDEVLQSIIKAVHFGQLELVSLLLLGQVPNDEFETREDVYYEEKREAQPLH